MGRLEIRTTKEEDEILSKKAKATGLTKTAIIKRLIHNSDNECAIEIHVFMNNFSRFLADNDFDNAKREY